MSEKTGTGRDWTALLDPPKPEPSPFRSHCDQCGRYIRRATVRTVTHWEGLDHDQFGHCDRCGEVGVTWSESTDHASSQA